MKKVCFFIAIFFTPCSASKQPVEITETGVPACIGKLIKKFETEPRQHPPRSIFSYNYNGNTMYYVSAPCCDMVSDLYDSACNLVGHPDGGFTGKGDGKMTDFNLAKTAEKLIWKDNR